MRKPLALCLALTFLCAALTGCTFHQGGTSAASTSAAPAPDGPTLRLGIYLPQDDPIAETIYTGAEYALLQRPSIQLDGVTYSVELYWPSADDAASLAEKLADSGCTAILGGLDATTCAAAAGTFRDASLPLLSLASDDAKLTKKNDLLFSAAPTAEAQGKALAKWALEQELTQAAVLTCVTDPYSVGVSTGFTQQLESKKGKVLTTQSVTADQTDFTDALKAIRQTDAQVVCAPVGLEQGILLLNQAGELGLKVQWVSGDRWSQDTLVNQTGVNSANVTVATAYQLGRNPDFETWAEQHLSSQSAWTWAALGSDSYDLLLDAITAANTQDGTAIAQALQRTHLPDGLSGDLSFDLYGDVTGSKVGLLTVKKGGFQLS